MNAGNGFTNELLLDTGKNIEKVKLGYSDIIRGQIQDKIKSIVENRGHHIMSLLGDKTVPWENLDSEIHNELSKKYTIYYAEILIKSGMHEINWLASFGYVLRNIIEYLKDKVGEKEYKETIYKIFSIIPDLTKIPLIDLELFIKNLGDKYLSIILSGRNKEENNYIKENLKKHEF